MARLVVTVDGQTAYDGDVPTAVLPSRPEQYPSAITPRPGTPPPPLARLMVMTSLLELIRRAVEHPTLAPATADIQTTGLGRATVTIDMGLPDGSLDA